MQKKLSVRCLNCTNAATKFSSKQTHWKPGRDEPLSKAIGQLYKDGKTGEADQAKVKTAELKDAIKNNDNEFENIDSQLLALQVQLPNIPSQLVPVGRSAEDNEIVAQGGEKPQLHAEAKPHWDLAAQYELIDFELGVKNNRCRISGI